MINVTCLYCNQIIHVNSKIKIGEGILSSIYYEQCNDCDIKYCFMLDNKPDVDPLLSAIIIPIKNDIKAYVYADGGESLIVHINTIIHAFQHEKIIHLPLSKLKSKILNLLPFI